MVLEKLSDKYSDKEYYDKHKYDESVEKVSVHLRVAPEIANGLVKVISIYRGYDIDKTELIKSELASLIFNEFVGNLPDDESALLDLFSKLKTFRDELDESIAVKKDANSYYADDDVAGGVANGEC